MLLLAAVLAVAVPVAPVGAGANGTTLPFQRHLARSILPGNGTATYAAAIQQQGTGGQGLVLYTSIDLGQSWQRDVALQPDAKERSTADLLEDADHGGFWAVVSSEPKSSKFAADAMSDVQLMHLALLRPGNFRIDAGPVVVFHPEAGEGYFRASLARDSSGALHVSASQLSGSTYSWLVRSSADGASFDAGTALLSGSTFAGGRLVAVGDSVLAVYDDYAPHDPGRFRLRPAGADGTWGAEQLLAPDGIYHAGAFSLTATPDGHAHLGYSDKAKEALHYREFDGAQWSLPLTMEPLGSWSNQAGLGHAGNTVLFAWNETNSSGPTGSLYSIRVRARVNGVWQSLPSPASSAAFKGYTATLESAEPGEPWFVLWCQQKTINVAPATAESAAVTTP